MRIPRPLLLVLLLGCHGESRSPGRIVDVPGQPAAIVLDSVFPAEATLLWLDGRPAHQSGARQLVSDGAGGWLAFDTALRSTPVPLALRGGTVAALASTRDGVLWGIDGVGALRSLADSTVLRPRILLGDVVADPATSALWVVRSPTRVTYRMPGETIPLFERLDPNGRTLEAIGSPWLPDDIVMQDLANAGSLVVVGDTLYFAPLIRDEVVAITRQGDTLWRYRRGYATTTTQPRFGMSGGRPTPEYQRINLGLALGPQGTLFLVSSADTLPGGRLDELDRVTGRLLATATLPSTRPTLAVADDGRVHLLASLALLAGAPPARTAVPDMPLPSLGDTLPRTLAEFRGKSVVLNFWASWCEPCRRELPLIDSLRRVLARDSIIVLGMNDDPSPGVAQRFVDDLAPGFPSRLGGGRLAQAYGLIGLPITMLLDARGVIVGQWIGELDAEAIRRVVAAARALAQSP